MPRGGTQNLVPLLLLWLFTLPAISPLLQPTLTDSADGLLHLYRGVALEQAIRQGELFPRWLPDLAFGYGFPLFVFYAPLAYYLAAALSGLGLGPVLAQNAALGLALLVAGSGVYFLAGDRLGPKAGLLAGVAYVYAPFQLNNALFRGGLPAAWALALYPFVFWAFGRLIRERTWRWLAPSAFIFGLALLAHNTLTLLFVPFLGFFLSLELFGQISSLSTGKLKFAQQQLLLSILALSLGSGLAAFFLVPAGVEQPYAQVQRVITSPDFDFRFHFVNFQTLFAWPQPANTGLLNPEFPPTLGFAQSLLAGLGLLLTLRRKVAPPRQPTSNEPPPFQPSLISFALTSLLMAVFMMLPFSRPLWEILPVIEFVQFPHRFLGPAALMLAILNGNAVAFLPERFSLWLTGFGLAFIFLTSIPLLYPRYQAGPIEPTMPGMFAYERATGAIGTTSFGEYLPLWVKQSPRESPLESQYAAGSTTVTRLDPAYLPPEAVIESAAYGFNQADLTINSPERFQAVFHTFYFPGWEAALDGQPVPVAPLSERGLLRVDLPAGRHRLQLAFHETPVRQAANGLSLISVLLLVGLVLSAHLTRPPAWPAAHRPLADREWGWLTLLALASVAAKLILFDLFDTPLKHSFDGQTLPGIDTTLSVNFGNQINLLGYDLPSSSVRPGETFELTAYWQAQQPLQTAYSSLAHLVDAEDNLYAGQDNLHPGTLPTTQWQPWGYVRDPHPVRVPFGAPPGDYWLALGLYEPSSWQRLPVLHGGHRNRADTVAVPVTVQPAERPATLAELDITWPVEAQFGELRLLGATPERETIRRNDFLRIALFWEATAHPSANYQIQIRLHPDQLRNQPSTPSTSLRASPPILPSSQQPAHNRYPTTTWSAGERVRDNHALWIEPDLPAGAYLVEVGVLDEAGHLISEFVEVGQLPAD